MFESHAELGVTHRELTSYMAKLIHDPAMEPIRDEETGELMSRQVHPDTFKGQEGWLETEAWVEMLNLMEGK